MEILAAFSIVIWFLAVGLVVLGTQQLWRHFKWTPAPERAPNLEPVSILKPVKGCEPGLEENLETFFVLDYPVYELLFSVADAADPAIPVIEKLIKKYPACPAVLIIGDVPVGPNPKINNCLRSYQLARHDWILISDSNVHAPPDYLRVTTEDFGPEVGIVTAVVAGVGPATLGGWLEATYLNTFYARWMFIASSFNQPCVVGKSMLFRRSTAERFGGLLELGRFLAEDYMAGQAMRRLGLEVRIMRQPIRQPLGRYTFLDFWRRHLRWGRIRKAQAPLPVFFEVWLTLFPSGLLGAFGFHELFGMAWSGFFVFHLALWLICDQLAILGLDGEAGLRSLFFCVIRETLSAPLWVQIWCGNSVHWRGATLQVKTGGTLELSQSR